MNGPINATNQQWRKRKSQLMEVPLLNNEQEEPI